MWPLGLNIGWAAILLSEISLDGQVLWVRSHKFMPVRHQSGLQSPEPSPEHPPSQPSEGDRAFAEGDAVPLRAFAGYWSDVVTAKA